MVYGYTDKQDKSLFSLLNLIQEAEILKYITKMGRLTSLKSITGVGARTIELESLSLFKSEVNTINPDVIPSNNTGKGENLKLPNL